MEALSFIEPERFSHPPSTAGVHRPTEGPRRNGPELAHGRRLQAVTHSLGPPAAPMRKPRWVPRRHPERPTRYTTGPGNRASCGRAAASEPGPNDGATRTRFSGPRHRGVQVIIEGPTPAIHLELGRIHMPGTTGPLQPHNPGQHEMLILGPRIHPPSP